MLDELLTQRLSAINGVELDFETTFANLTTLRIGGHPRALVRCESVEAAIEALQALQREEYLIVGGGSNLVVVDGDVDVIAVALDCEDISITGGTVYAEAGALWDDVVDMSVNMGLGGIECLSGIPGCAGAVPVQNVGAYGAEISDVLTRALLFDKETATAQWVDAASLELAYRYSNLKFTGRGVVLAIEMQLTEDGLSKPLRFGQLTQNPGERLPVAQVRQSVLELRRAKGMVLDPEDNDTWSAGSFFTNPIVPSAVADAIEAKLGLEMPRHPAGEGKEKLSAAWLIEKAGFAKGYPGQGPATLSTKHTLALTNRGKASAQDIVNLARDIRGGVHTAFDVTLEPEPIWLGCEIGPLA